MQAMLQAQEPPGSFDEGAVGGGSGALPLREWIRRARAGAPNDGEYLALAVSLGLELVEGLIKLAEGSKAAADSRTSSDPGFGAAGVGAYSSAAALGGNDEDDDSINELNDDLGAYFDLLETSIHNEERGTTAGGSKADAPLGIKIEDIAPENVLVKIAASSPDDVFATNLAVAGVDIVAVSQGGGPLPSEMLGERDLCHALGGILFEVFSRGDPILLIDLDSEQNGPRDAVGTSDDDADSFSKMLLEVMGPIDIDDDDEVTPEVVDDNSDAGGDEPSSKKSSHPRSGERHSAPASTKAKLHLLERGLPLPVCRLVSDLLDAEPGNLYASDTALVSLEDARFDLVGMKTLPEKFLVDQTDPAMALESTSLFNHADGELYGREQEMNELMDAVARVSMHFPTPCVGMNGSNHSWGQTSQQQGQQQYPWAAACDDFLVEAAFISGHSGSGKSSITRQLVFVCSASNWSAVVCKFDRQVAPLVTLLQAVDSFFCKFAAKAEDPQMQPDQALGGGASQQQRRDPAVQETFDRISRSLIASIDPKSFVQLCILLPSLSVLFPMSMAYVQDIDASSQFDELVNCISNNSSNVQSSSASSHSLGAMGSGSNRLNYLFSIVFKAICSGGHPVLICLEDTQWADAATLGIVGDLIETVAYGVVSFETGKSLQGGLLYLANFRDNEVSEDGLVMNQIRALEQSQGNVNVTKIDIGGLALSDVNKMLSYKLCLPVRHTRELAQLVYQKTRGNPLFTVEFLRSIIQSNALVFSVRERKWVWDETCIDMQMISEGVVELLTIKLKKLPLDVITALKVMACFGSQITMSAVELLDLGQFVRSMPKALELAVKEGIIEKAGPVFAFIHDTLQESSYSLIPEAERNPLHKMIGMSLAHDPEMMKDAEFCQLAVDQINLCKDSDGILGPSERAQFATLNLTAGKYSVRTSSYEQARGYFLAGISLLHADHWEKQYSLALELHEWLVLVCFMDGNVENSSSLLDAILANAKTFEDSLNARAMFAKLMVAQERYAEGVKSVVELLAGLGEVFSSEVDASHATKEIETTMPLLANVSKETILGLPYLADRSKLSAMKFLGLLIHFANFYSPLLVHLVSCRMIQITFKYGYCEDAIVALVTFAHGMILYLYPNDVELTKRIKSTAEALIRGHPNEHSLNSRLTLMLTSVNVKVEPGQAVVEKISNGYKSAKMVGDIDNAMSIASMGCVITLCCVSDLRILRRQAVDFIHEMARHKRMGPLRSVMSVFNVCTILIGSDDIDVKIEIKTNMELYEIAEQTRNDYLMYHIIFNKMQVHSIFRDHLAIIELAQRYRMHAGKRAGDYFLDFTEGLAALAMARDTKQEQWRSIGETSVEAMTKLVSYSSWNYENKLLLLQAELHYTNGRNVMAELLYQAAIESAHEHRFLHEEALALELFGAFLVENRQTQRGLEQLRMSADKYRRWGSMKKVRDVEDFILITQTTISWKP